MAVFFSSPEQIILLSALVITILLLLFAVDWRYFRDWVAVYLFKSTIDLVFASVVVESGLISYPVRYLPQYFDTSLIFDILVFPAVCVLYNQIARTRGVGGAVFYAIIFGGVLTFIEYPLELYTQLIKYNNWTWYFTFGGITTLFLISRVFLAFYSWGCEYWDRRYM